MMKSTVIFTILGVFTRLIWVIPTFSHNFPFQTASFLIVKSRTKLPAIKQGKRYYSKGDSPERNSDDVVLQGRLLEQRRRLIEESFRRPPNPSLAAQEFVSELLRDLYDSGDPIPESGFRVLLRSSTIKWKQSLYRSVGAPSTAELDTVKSKTKSEMDELVASALGQAMERPNNQWAILVGEGEKYIASFPSEPVEYGDGTAWLECRLRDARDNTLLVVMGWQLKQRKTDGAWLVDGIDWQDFRDEFRPGIGREEWMRVCG